MKFLIFFAAVIGASLAQSNYFRQPYAADHRPTYSRNGIQERYARILKNSFDISPDGNYQYAYETENGIAADQNGYPKVIPGIPPEVAETVQGRFSWTSPEGQFISVGYIADEHGYRPVGNAIPTPPPIPAAILRSIEYNKQQEALRNRKF